MICTFHPAAEAEHLESVAYFESRKAGLGASYLADADRALDSITAAPQRYPVVQPPDIRSIRLARFPFSILYRASGDIVLVLAIAHARRRPLYWLGRLQSGRPSEEG